MKATVTIPPKSVGRFLRGIRMENENMHIKDAALLVGCESVSNYTNIENGKRSITPAKMLEYTTKLLGGDQSEALNRLLIWAMQLQIEH